MNFLLEEVDIKEGENSFKHMIRKIIIRAIVFIVVAVSTAFFVNKFNNVGYENASREMNEPTLPLVYCQFEDRTINLMRGYTQVMSTSLMRDNIVPVDNSKNVKILVKDQEKYATSFSYELRSIAGDSLIEKGDFEVGSTQNGYNSYDVSFRMDMDLNQEYMLVVVVNGSDDEITRYYTRVVRLQNQHTRKIIDYALNFHEATFMEKKESNLSTDVEEGENKKIVKEIMKANNDENSDDLSHVDLNSSYDMVCWGDMTPIAITGIIPSVIEVDNDYAVIKISYVIQTINSEPNHRYNVDEYYCATYNPNSEEVELLAFDRYVDSFFDEDYISKDRNSIGLGITSQDDVNYLVSNNLKKVAFVKQGQLWLYDYAQERLTSVFSFSNGNLSDIRIININHGINISNVDDDGNIDFVVYGYVCRGRNEGKNGVSLYHFDANTSKIEETFFVQCDETYDVMVREVGRFSYYDVTTNSFFYLLDGRIIKANVEAQTQEVLSEDIPAELYKVSDSGKIIAYPNNSDASQVTEINVMNFINGETYVEKCDASSRIMNCGFVGEDLIYGIANKNDIVISADGEAILPLNRIYIISATGEQLKEYSKNEIYVTDARVDGEKIYLQRAMKRNNFFLNTDPDFIVYKREVNDQKMQLVSNFDSVEYKNWDIKFPSNMYLSNSVAYVITKGRNNEISSDINISTTTRENAFYVFDNSGYVGEYKSAGKSILVVEDKKTGLVVDSNGNTIYRKIDATGYNTIADNIDERACVGIDKSLLTCAYMCIKYVDHSVEYEDIMASGSWENAFAQYTNGVGINISGIDLDTALYFLDRDIPFAARIEDGRYVLVISYNSTHIRYYDPIEGEEVKITRDKFEELLSMQSNTMYTYTSQ